ncbi:MAG: hypothetical protein HDT25_00310 [Ruminococcus sp.]|nr:hypothetical protein [Ruminococcus sp.]
MSKRIIENLSKMNINRQDMIKQGFSAQKYDDVQRGRSTYKIDDLIEISEKFRLTLDYLVYGNEKNFITELTETEQKMLLFFRKLREDDKFIEIGRCEAIVEKYNIK